MCRWLVVCLFVCRCGSGCGIGVLYGFEEVVVWVDDYYVVFGVEVGVVGV